MREPGRIANPFPGLRPFETDEYLLFFGREGQSDELLARLGRTRFLAVVGTSGSGKSSLVRAGLLPSLRGGLMRGAGAGWRVALMRPGSDPVGNLAEALAERGVLAEAGGGLGGAEAQAVIEATLRAGSLGLVGAARQARLSEHDNLLVVVDQFEELFRFRALSAGAGTADDAAAFVKLLLEAALQRELPIYVVLTMRSDFLGDCAQFQGLPEAINDGQYLIPRMTRDERRAAVVGPARVARGRVAEQLVNRLLNDVGDNPDQLPILQHALMRTWGHWQTHRRDSEPVSVEHYEAVGTMTDALSRHADEAWGELDERQRMLAEWMFRALTEKGADNREIRRPTRLRELCEITEASAEEMIAVVEVFRREGRSFLMPPAGVPLDPECVIDISHESLIRNWGRLRKWVDEEGGCARTYRRLAESALLHREGTEGLLNQVALQNSLDWQQRAQPNAAWGVRYHPEFDLAMQYLSESKAHHEAERAREEEHRQAELERERREREQAERYAAEQRRAARRLRYVALVMLVLVIVSGVAFAYAFVMERRADEAKRRAEAIRERLLLNRHALQMIQSYEMEQAEKELQQIYSLNGNDREGREGKAWALYNLGELNRKLERYDQAAAFFESALETEMMVHGRLGLDSVGTLDSLAFTLAEGRNYLAAIRRYEQLSALLGGTVASKGRYFKLNSANVYSDLANLYVTEQEFSDEPRSPAQRTGIFRKAAQEYQKAVPIWEEVFKDDREALSAKYDEWDDFLKRTSALLRRGQSGGPDDAALLAELGRKEKELQAKRRAVKQAEAAAAAGPAQGSSGHRAASKYVYAPPRNPGDDPAVNVHLSGEGPGYMTFNHDPGGDYARPETVAFVQKLGAEWAARHPDLKLVVGDLSRRGGGLFPPHIGHQDGREVDIWALSNSGLTEPTNIFAPNYSHELTKELVELVNKLSPEAVIYFDDQKLVDEGLTESVLDHYNYVHILLP